MAVANNATAVQALWWLDPMAPARRMPQHGRRIGGNTPSLTTARVFAGTVLAEDGSRSNGDAFTELIHDMGGDATDAGEVFDLLIRAVCRPVVNDPLGNRRANRGERL